MKLNDWILPEFDQQGNDFNRYVQQNIEINTHDAYQQLLQDSSFELSFEDVYHKLGLKENCDMMLISDNLKYPSRRHSHDYYEIPFVVKGKLLHIINGIPHIMPQNSFSLIPPGIDHVIASYQHEETVVVNILVSCHLIEKFGELLNAPFMPITKAVWVEDDINPFITQTIRQLIYTYYRNSYHLNLGVLGYLMTLFQYLIDTLEHKHDDVLDDLCLQVLRIMKEHPAQVNMTMLTDATHYSAGYLSRHIKQVTGQTISQHIAQIRLNYAMELLVETDMSITDIALMAGYQSESHFYRIFKEVNKLTPAKYRQYLKK